ncbi:MAG: outer membrane beta-barrel protein [Elusimicrobia bacterium]|nr:outer membrane beta-barrel protein [Elusimicrobiota bacterium]
MSRSALFIASLCVALVASMAPANAGMFDALDSFQKPNMHYGPVDVHPYLRYTETYDSNIFLQPDSHVAGQNANNNTAGPVLGSWINTLGLGFTSSVALAEMHKLDLAYDLAYKAYTKDPSNNNTVNQDAGVLYTYTGPMGMSGHARDSYMNTVDPATSEQVKRTPRWENMLGVDGQYAPEGGMLSFGVDAGQTTDKYVSDPVLGAQLNRYAQLFGFKVGYQVMPKTRAYVAYHRQLTHFTAHPGATSKDNKAHLVDFGVEGRIAPKLTGQIQTGLQYRQYDEAAFAGASKTTRNWMIATKLTYKPIERTMIDLNLSRALVDSTFGNSQFYIATSAMLDVKHQLPYKLTAGVNLGLESDKYAQSAVINGASVQRRDDIDQIGASLDYNIQEWLKAGLSYAYRTRFSKDASEQFNYTDSITSVSLGVTF